MRTFSIAAMAVSILFIISAGLSAESVEKELSRKLTQRYKTLISSTETGKRFYERFEGKRGKKYPVVKLKYSNSSGLAWYELGRDSVFINTKYLMIFFDIKGYKAAKIREIMNSNKTVLTEFTAYTDSLYLHELIHCLQDSIYGKNRYMKEGGLFMEFEYEAYFISDMYFHEKMKKNPALLKKIVSGEYSDVYTASEMEGYLNLSMNPEEYRENIKKRYAREMSGYVALNEEEAYRGRKLEEEKLLSYANGDEKDYKAEKKDYERLSAQRKDYTAFLEDFYRKYWPSFSAEALGFITDSAIEAKNYSLALEASSFAESNSGFYGLDEKGVEKLKTKAALAVLSASSDIKEKYAKGEKSNLALELKALEKACFKSGRPFPQQLLEIRKYCYSEALKKYLSLSALEKDPERLEFYRENVDFFSEALSSGTLMNAIK